jgi:hypothetical protein
MKYRNLLTVALAIMLVASFALAVASLVMPRPALAKPPDPGPKDIWYGCLCEEIEYAWECVGQANAYRCCDEMCWRGYWHCRSGYYIVCHLPPGCDSYPW